MNMTVEQFCDLHGACQDGRDWALATGQTLDEIWHRTDLNPERRIWIATRRGVLDDKALRLFACWCVRQVWHILTDERSKTAVEVAERFAAGEATTEALAAARDAAWAACDVAWAVWAAACDTACDAVWAAARAAARAAQSAWLLENATPNWEMTP